MKPHESHMSRDSVGNEPRPGSPCPPKPVFYQLIQGYSGHFSPVGSPRRHGAYAMRGSALQCCWAHSTADMTTHHRPPAGHTTARGEITRFPLHSPPPSPHRTAHRCVPRSSLPQGACEFERAVTHSSGTDAKRVRRSSVLPAAHTLPGEQLACADPQHDTVRSRQSTPVLPHAGHAC